MLDDHPRFPHSEHARGGKRPLSDPRPASVNSLVVCPSNPHPPR